MTAIAEQCPKMLVTSHTLRDYSPARLAAVAPSEAASLPGAFWLALESTAAGEITHDQKKVQSTVY